MEDIFFSQFLPSSAPGLARGSVCGPRPLEGAPDLQPRDAALGPLALRPQWLGGFIEHTFSYLLWFSLSVLPFSFSFFHFCYSLELPSDIKLGRTHHSL